MRTITTSNGCLSITQRKGLRTLCRQLCGFRAPYLISAIKLCTCFRMHGDITRGNSILDNKRFSVLDANGRFGLPLYAIVGWALDQAM